MFTIELRIDKIDIKKSDIMKYRKQEEKKLPTDVFSRLMKIFRDKSWEIEDGPNEVSLFNRFCSTLTDLTKDQQILVLEMTERFTRIRFEEYLIHIKTVLDKLVDCKTIDIENVRSIYIAPLISPEDFGKSKSSTMVQYSIRGIINNIPMLAYKSIGFIDGLNVDRDKINKEDSILILVDDFVGTGETAFSAVNYLNSDLSINKNKIVVLTIAALEAGISYLEGLGINIITALVFNKGISDFYPAELVAEKITLMESIEKKIKVHKNERLGFKSSEALITLIRTPNNTFPVFWKEKKNRIAPFPR